MAKLQLGDGHAEGRFFPDTYGYKKGTRISDVLLRANERMHSVLARAWANRAPGLPYTTPDEALIMASIIEKETGRESETRQDQSRFRFAPATRDASADRSVRHLRSGRARSTAI